MKKTLFSGLLLAFLLSSALGADSVHVGIHRHLHQPIYWGEPVPSRPNQTQFGRDSQLLKDANNAYYGDSIQHPEVALVGGNDSVFEDPDKQNAYQNWIHDSINQMSPSDSGMTISFSGALQRNLWSFGRDNNAGYTPSWNAKNITAHGWTTSGGNPRAEVLGQTYNHAFSPLLPKSVLRKQIEMQRERTRKSWGLNPDMSDQSKGFWPIELAFSRHMIPILLEFGYEWTMVANSHIARTCPNYMDALDQPSPGFSLTSDPPNPADQLGPTVPLNQWYGANRDTYGNVFPVPFAYQAHRAQYIDPETGDQETIIVTPQCDYHGYQSGYGAVGWDFIDGIISTYNDTNQPNLVMLTNDGENFWGGGYSFWMEFAPNFINDASSHGKQATTIQEFLDNHPVPTNDVIHVEDGSWAAADQGSPQFYRWLEPPRETNNAAIDLADANTLFNIPEGWHTDLRNWAVMMAGINYCETAEQITEDGGSPVLAWRIEEPYQDDGTSNNPLPAESAWHFLMWGFDSGFVYFGTALDDEVKHTFAANRAISIATGVIGNASGDATPPSVFKPQRFPWNPGGKGKGQYLSGLTSGGGTVGFTTDPWPSDFHVWSLVHDVSGVTNVTLKVRVDDDGTNPLSDTANETYAGGAGVGGWQSIPMNRHIMPKHDPTGNSGLSYFVLPDQMADKYWASVEGFRDELLDYYIEAYDSKGNLHKSEIQHVYVEDDGSAPSPVTFSSSPSECTPLGVTYNAEGRTLDAENPIYQQISFDGGGSWNRFMMNNVGGKTWNITNAVPTNSTEATVWFENTAGSITDSDGGINWSISLSSCDTPTGSAAVVFSPAAPDGCGPVAITYFANAGPLQTATQVYLHVGRNGPAPWEDVTSEVMTNNGDGSWTTAYTPLPGTFRINCVFNDGTTWDNNGGADWYVAVSNCVSIFNPTLCAVEGSPAIQAYLPSPSNQNQVGEAFDMDPSGGSAPTMDQSSFGDLGELYINYDASHLYIGGHGASLADSNGMVILVAVDTLPDNRSQLWDTSGLPEALDSLHNVLFVTPFDIAIVLGNEWGDYTQNTGTLPNGYAWGQGVYYLSTNAFNLVAGAQLSQFDGTNTNATASTNDDGNENTDRWEAGIPWGSLSASGIESISSMQIAGLLGADAVSGPDRYLSANYIGASATGTLNGSGDFGFNFVNLTGVDVCLPHLDGDSDGLSNGFEIRYFNDPSAGLPGEDSDGDSFDNAAESQLGTNPTNASSALTFSTTQPSNGLPGIHWSTVGGKSYAVEYRDGSEGDLFEEAMQVTESDVPDGQESTEQFTDDFTLTGSDATNGFRIYRVRLAP